MSEQISDKVPFLGDTSDKVPILGDTSDKVPFLGDTSDKTVTYTARDSEKPASSIYSRSMKNSYSEDVQASMQDYQWGFQDQLQNYWLGEETFVLFIYFQLLFRNNNGNICFYFG